jgi:hypothetical protein
MGAIAEGGIEVLDEAAIAYLRIPRVLVDQVASHDRLVEAMQQDTDRTPAPPRR